MVEMGCGGGFRPYFDPDFDSLVDRMNPASVSVDNDAREDCTLVKVDSANKHGILLEMVQVLTDLDLVVSKSYISSDGGWLMDERVVIIVCAVFHVTDELGNKIVDPSVIRYIQQSMLLSGRPRLRRVETCQGEEVRTCTGRVVVPRRHCEEATALEVVGTDRPGLLSDIAAVLSDINCHVASAEAWSHSSRVAMVFYLTDQITGKPISGNRAGRLGYIEEQVRNVVRIHHDSRERWSVGVLGPTSCWVHTERRLHQMMQEDRECCSVGDRQEEEKDKESMSPSLPEAQENDISIECCWEKGYSVVNIVSRDRPKLFFDTVCTLTDMAYVVSHATVRSKGSLALQEYFIRRMDGQALDSESERRRVERCLAAAINRRPSHGLRFNVCTRNRTGLLSDVTRVFREHSLSMTRAEIGTRGEKATGSFFVTDTSGNEVRAETIESVRQEIGGTMVLEVNRFPPWRPLVNIPTDTIKVTTTTGGCGGGVTDQRWTVFSLGSLLRYGIERLSNNFRYIRS